MACRKFEKKTKARFCLSKKNSLVWNAFFSLTSELCRLLLFCTTNLPEFVILLSHESIEFVPLSVFYRNLMSRIVHHQDALSQCIVLDDLGPICIFVQIKMINESVWKTTETRNQQRLMTSNVYVENESGNTYDSSFGSVLVGTVVTNWPHIRVPTPKNKHHSHCSSVSSLVENAIFPYWMMTT